MKLKSLSTESKYKLFGRIGAFVLCTLLVIINEQGLTKFFENQLFGINLYKYVWFIIVVWLVRVIFPKKNEKMSSGRRWRDNFSEGETDLDLKPLALESTKKAYKSQWLYLIFLFGFYFVYITFHLSYWWAIVFTLWAGVLDAWFVTIWCPYRNCFLKHKCCDNCRIYNWGYLMATLPLLVMPSFWTYSIVTLALIIFIQWEYLFHKFPERFFEERNKNLRCINCPGKTGYCQKDHQG